MDYESDIQNACLLEGDPHAGALILGQPSSYSNDYSSNTDDPSGIYLQGTSSRTKEIGSSSTVLVINDRPTGHTHAPRLHMEDRITRNARPDWVGKPPNCGAYLSYTSAEVQESKTI